MAGEKSLLVLGATVLTFLVRHCARLVFLLCLAIVLFAVFRPEPPPELFRLSDKVGHVLGFVALGLSGRFAFPRLHYLIFWPPLLLMAWALEWLQALLQPSRIYSQGDTVANLAGVVLALGVWVLWRKVCDCHQKT